MKNSPLEPDSGLVLQEGMTFTIEPMINQGEAKIKTKRDGWTVVTRDKKLSAQWEHTIAVTADGLGLPTEGIIGQEFEYGAVVFIQLQPGLRLALWPRKSIAHDTGLLLAPPNATEIIISHNVSTKSDVDSIMATAKVANARIIKPAHDTFWGGYAVFFRTRTVTFGKSYLIQHGFEECYVRNS